MGIKENVKSLEDDLKEVSYAMELLQEEKKRCESEKKQNKRLFIIIIIFLLAYFTTVGYLVYILNDIDTEEVVETYDIDQNSDNNGNNNFINGSDNEVNN